MCSMAATIPTREPLEFTQGETVRWTKSLSDYLPDDSWVLSYAFVYAAASSDQQTATATDNGDGTHLVTIASTASDDFSIGVYNWQASVTDGSTTHIIGSGSVTVLAGFAAQSSGYDSRSHAKKMLDAIEDLAEGRSGESYSSYVLPSGRQLVSLSPAELIEWRSFYKREYDAKLAAERIGAGLGNPNKIRTRRRGMQ